MAAQNIKPGQLRAFVPFDRFSAESVIVAAGQAEMVEFAAGDEVLGVGSVDEHDYYLLNGAVELTDVEGTTRSLSMGADGARRALAPFRPSRHQVTARSYVRACRIPRFVIEMLAQEQPREGVSLTDLSQEITQTREFFTDFARDLAARRVKLPPCPDLARTIRKAIASHNNSARDIARIISVDPAIAAKILKIANSPIFRGNRRIEALPEAVTRIGLHTVGELVICFTLRDVVKVKNPILKRHFRRNLEEAVNVAALAELLVHRYELPWRESATVGGLLHNIGVLPILTYAAEHPAYLENTALLRRAALRFTGEVGKELALAWDLGERYVRVTEHARDWRYSGSDTDLVDVVIASRYLYAVKRHGAEVAPPAASVPAVARVLECEPEPALIAKLLGEAQTSVASLKKLILA